MRNAVVVQELGKQFRRYHADRPKRLKELFVRGPRWLKPTERFWALRQVSFSVAPGRMLGIIGPNGSGKSTLLHLIGDIMRPDEGCVETHGQIGALLNLGAGFHPDLTGRENVFVSGVVTGFTRQEVAQRFDSIVAFAELEEFIDSPLRTYSSGMKVRLGFAVAAHIDPQILLIDEVLAVGDIAFQNKCFERIKKFKNDGCTILFVSHSGDQIQKFCDEALWLHNGQPVAHGDPKEVVNSYVTKMQRETRRRTPATAPVLRTSTNAELRINENRFGSLELEIVDVRLFDREGLSATELNSGDPLRVEIEYLAPDPIVSPIFGATISRKDRPVCCNTNTRIAGLTLPTLQGRGRIVLHFERLDLAGGQYYVNVGVHEQKWSYTYDFHQNVYPLRIRPTPGNKKAVLYPPHHWEIDGTPTL